MAGLLEDIDIPFEEDPLKQKKQDIELIKQLMGFRTLVAQQKISPQQFLHIFNSFIGSNPGVFSRQSPQLQEAISEALTLVQDAIAQDKLKPAHPWTKESVGILGPGYGVLQEHPRGVEKEAPKGLVKPPSTLGPLEDLYYRRLQKYSFPKELQHRVPGLL